MLHILFCRKLTPLNTHHAYVQQQALCFMRELLNHQGGVLKIMKGLDVTINIDVNDAILTEKRMTPRACWLGQEDQKGSEEDEDTGLYLFCIQLRCIGRRNKKLLLNYIEKKYGDIKTQSQLFRIDVWSASKSNMKRFVEEQQKEEQSSLDEHASSHTNEKQLSGFLVEKVTTAANLVHDIIMKDTTSNEDPINDIGTTNTCDTNPRSKEQHVVNKDQPRKPSIGNKLPFVAPTTSSAHTTSNTTANAVVKTIVSTPALRSGQQNYLHKDQPQPTYKSNQQQDHNNNEPPQPIE